MSISKCVYCGSTAFGPGCPYSAHRRHFHAGDAKRCCWCNSVAQGPSCPFNPFGKNHIHGVEFNQMMGDSVENGIVLGYLMKTLSEPYTNTKAFSLKLIDENGTILRKPETDEEKVAFGVLEEYMITIKKLLGNKLDMVNTLATVKLQESMSIQDYERINAEKLKYKEEFKKLGESFNKLTQEAHLKGLSTGAIEEIIVNSIFNKK